MEKKREKFEKREIEGTRRKGWRESDSDGLGDKERKRENMKERQNEGKKETERV